MVAEAQKRPSAPRRPLSAVARNALVGLASLSVLVLAISYVFSPPQLSIADELTVAAIPSINTVFYGKVTDTAGKPVYRARVDVYHYYKGRKVYDAVAYTGRNGIYRKVTKRQGTTYSQVSVKMGGRTIKSPVRKFTAYRGKAYRISARLVRRSSIVFLPIFSY